MQKADLSLRANLTRSTWVLALEVAEHVPPLREPALLANIEAHGAEGVVLSWSDSWGNGHYNMRSAEYVKYRMAALGLGLDAPATAALRRSVSTFHWFARDLTVFRRDRGAAAQFARLRSEVVRGARPVGLWSPSSETYRAYAGLAYNDFRRCGTCCGAPFDHDLEPGGASAMCRGSNFVGGVFGLSVGEAQARCTADATCAGFFVYNGSNAAARGEVRPVTRMRGRKGPPMRGWIGYERIAAPGEPRPEPRPESIDGGAARGRATASAGAGAERGAKRRAG